MHSSNMSLGKYVSIIHRHGRIFIDEKLGQYGIGSGQAPFLMALYHNDGIRQEDLCKSINIDKGTTARALKKLESSGYVSRQRDSSDKRAYSIHLTKKALDFKSELRKIFSEWTDALANGLTEEESFKALELLQALANNAVEETAALHRTKEQEKTL